MERKPRAVLVAAVTVAAGFVATGGVAASAAPTRASVSAADPACLLFPGVILGDDGPNAPLRGTSRSDVIASLGGDDVVLGADANDKICLGPGRDIGKGGPGSDEFITDPVPDGRDDFYGDDGADSVRYLGRSVGVTVTLDGVANDGQAGEQDNVRLSTENVQGTGFADQIVGNDLANVFIGGDGDDDLRGGLGDDDLYGVWGDDLIIGNAGNDHLSGLDGDDRFVTAGSPDGDDEVFGGNGFDTMDYSGRNAGFGVTVVLDNDFNDGSTGEFDNIRTDVEHVIGGAGADNLTAGAYTDEVANRLVGGFGNDTLNSIDGAWDVVDGGPGLDLCLTDPGDYVINCELP